jgi:uncharacterized membrane protein YeaQ/YmgE (transglycosylase-associated protein family)
MGGGIIQMIVVGLIVGLLARAIMPGEQKIGLILTTLLGLPGPRSQTSSAARLAGTSMAPLRAGSRRSSVP